MCLCVCVIHTRMSVYTIYYSLLSSSRLCFGHSIEAGDWSRLLVSLAELLGKLRLPVAFLLLSVQHL